MDLYLLLAISRNVSGGVIQRQVCYVEYAAFQVHILEASLTLSYYNKSWQTWDFSYTQQAEMLFYMII